MNQKKILLLGRKHSIQKEKVDDLYHALGSHVPDGYSLSVANYNELIFDIQPSRTKVFLSTTGEDLSSFDLVYMMSWYSYVPTRRDIAYSIAIYLKNRGIPFINDEAYYNRSSSKISQMLLLAEHNIKVPRTVFSLSAAALINYVGMQPALKDGKLIVKDALASRGASNYLCTFDELSSLPIGRKESQPFIVQPCIPNDGSDIRAVVMGYEIKLLIHRTGSGESHLNNTSQGGKAELVSEEVLQKSTIDDIINTSKLLNRTVTGIDVMRDTGTNEYYVLEANALPQLATGSFVDEKMQKLAETLVNIIERERTT